MRRVIIATLLAACAAPKHAPAVGAEPAPAAVHAEPIAETPSADAGVPESQPADAAVPESQPAEAETVPADVPSDPYAGIPLDPSWPKRLFVVTDSVVLGAKPYLFRALRGWKIDFHGRPALPVYMANAEVRKVKGRFPSVAVVAVGYNSIWYAGRKHYAACAKKFDRTAEHIVAILKKRGVKKIVWMLLREINASNIPDRSSARHQLVKAGFYFPYVNERLRALHERHPDIALGDWTSASADLGFTADAIHVNKKGALKMVEVIEKAIGIPAPAPP